MTQRAAVTECSICGEKDENRVRRGSLGMCRRCYEAELKTRHTCDICGRGSFGRYCQRHYRNMKLHGIAQPVRFVSVNYCSVRHCYGIVQAFGLCGLHHQRSVRKAIRDLEDRAPTITCAYCGESQTLGLTGFVPDLCRQCSRRFDHMRRRYGIGVSEYRRIMEEQQGKCAICGRSGEWLAVDHDHRCCPPERKTCGRCVRGLLCSNCNSGLGMFGEDPQVISRAISYLHMPTTQTSAST
jgi:hypothetical protein